ncbi:APC family permease [Couchioplanes caeruleus]|uniref:APC family permease n=1 Tax=Couchioplanes caeruleus TaxID=56438 RepID=UPI0020BF19D8|nr:APC family permease [Couchioplanes caeruleus]UQU67588.1 APC family permease [Couchioplanes caeruleus]
MATETRSRATGPGTGSIGLVSCVAFAVGTMVGAGVFVLSGLAVERAGPAAIASFVLAGVLVLLSALSFAVVASLAPPGGSGYAYVGQALGRRWGFLTSWAFWLGGVIGVAFVLNAFGRYLHDFFLSALPPTLVAVAAVVVIALLNIGPASLIGRAETALVVVKVAILVLLIVFAFIHIGRAHFTPFAPHGAGSVVTTSALLFIAYLGFNVVTNMAGDVERPQRTIPLAILLSMGIVALIYVGVVVALLAGQISTYDEASVGTAAKHLIGDWGGILIPIGALISTLSAANANMLGSSEIMVRLAGDRQVPTVAGRLWHGHPAVSVLAAAVTAVILLLTGGIQAIIALGNVAAIVAMVLVNAAAFRAQRRKHRAGIRLPAGPLLPALGLLAALVQLVFIGWWQTLLGLVLVAAGLGLHALRGHHQAQHHAVITGHLHQNTGPAGRALRRHPAKEA